MLKDSTLYSSWIFPVRKREHVFGEIYLKQYELDLLKIDPCVGFLKDGPERRSKHAADWHVC